MQLRAKMLNGLHDRHGLWRSDATGYLFQWFRGHWRMFFGGEWVDYYTPQEYRPFVLHAKAGETFIRVGSIQEPEIHGQLMLVSA